MAGQVMEAPATMHQQQASMLLSQLHQANCKSDHHFAATTTTTTATTTNNNTAAAEMAYLHHLQQTAAAAEADNSSNGNGQQRGEQCPRCASHDTKFCYYNNYNTSQPRHFCRACRRYWTLGGSLRNIPIGGSTRKRPRLAPQPPASIRRQHHHHSVVFGGAGGVPAAPAPTTQGLLGSLFALGAAPLLEGRGGGGFDLGLGLTIPGGAAFGGVGEMQGHLGLRGGTLGATSSSALLWPAGLLDNDNVDAWKVPAGVGAATSAAMWPTDLSAAAAAAAPPQQTGGMLNSGAQLM